MKKKKTLLIVIIVLLVILVLAGAAFAYIYFGTDLFKTDKELFSKYILTIGDNEKGLLPKVLDDYMAKKETAIYENNGSISVINSLPTGQSTDIALQQLNNMVDIANNTNITFSGIVDNTNKMTQEDITINYTDTVNLPFKYRQEGDIYAIQADILSPNYFAVENNNLQQFFRNLGVTDISSIPNKIEATQTNSLQFTDEELTNIFSKYIMPMYNNLSEDKFSKTENANGTNEYILTLTNEDLRNIGVQMLQTLSNDTQMLGRINQIAKEMYGDQVDTITSEDILSLVDSLSSLELEQGNITITLVENDKIVNEIRVQMQEITMDILKNQTDSNLSYNVSINEAQSGMSVELVLSYTGINTNNISEDMSLNINTTEQVGLSFTFNNIVSFGTGATIEPLGNDVAILNNYSKEQLQPFLVQAVGIIAQTNSNQMKQIGFNELYINPMVMWVTAQSIYSSMQMFDGMLQTQEQIQDQYENEEINSNQIFTNMEHYINGTIS